MITFLSGWGRGPAPRDSLNAQYVAVRGTILTEWSRMPVPSDSLNA